MRYLKGTSNNLERIILIYLIDIKSMTNSLAIDVETLMIGNKCFLKKEFIKLIRINI